MQGGKRGAARAKPPGACGNGVEVMSALCSAASGQLSPAD